MFRPDSALSRLRSASDPLFAAWCAALFVRLHGLPVGVGNQSLHLAWIRHLRNPDLFAADPVIGSFSRFPSYFFQLLAGAVPSGVSPETALQTLQVLNTALLFLGMIRLGRVLFPESRWMLLVPLLVLIDPTRALAETPLPPLAFSHTGLGLTLSLFGLEAVFRDRWKTAAVLFGVLVNLHLLTAAYAGAIAAAHALRNWKQLTFRQWLLPLGIGAALASPTLLQLAFGSGAAFDANWALLLRERSAHHIYPDAWWETGNPVVGAFALSMAWLAVGLAMGSRGRRHSARTLLWAVPAGLMLLGGIGVYLFPHPWLIRAQLFRTSIYPLLLGFWALAAAGEREWRRPSLPASRVLVALAAAVLLLPNLHAFQPHVLVMLSIAAWIGGGLRPPHALTAAAAFLLLTASDRLLNTRFWSPGAGTPPEPAHVLLIAGSTLLAGALVLHSTRRRALLASLATLGLAAALHWLPPAPRAERDAWTDIQRAARRHTPVNARILTPVRHAGFRDASHRAIVGEWRDGTMQFFDPGFAEAWSKRMRLLAPERVRRFSADDWIAAGKRFNAPYAVLPADRARGLVPLAQNREWALVKTERPPPPPLPEPPPNVVDADAWREQERFYLEVVEPNIRRHRIRDVTLSLQDPDGRSLAGLPVEITQTRLAFGIGSALHHFEEVPQREKGFNAPRVHPRELELFPEVFNYSVIGYSGKWFNLEPEPGRRGYADLDAYVAWCDRRDITLEFHFVTGYEPAWMKDKPKAFRKTALLAHANALIDRYGDRIDRWQIVNERRMQGEAPEVFALFRERLPGDSLGISHCARFYTRRKGQSALLDLTRGMRSLEEIRAAGREVDFFAFHGHRPFGLWSDPRTMYRVLDEFQEAGVRIVVSETGISHAGPIVGDVREGDWTPALQAEYLVRYLKTLYSHPGVDAVNFWGFGARTWQKHIGLLDDNHEPLPAFHALRRLVKEEWNSRAEGRADRYGKFRFQGHLGTYRVTVRHPDGRVSEGTFQLGKDASEDMTVVLL